jgi:hypothetical protein
VAGISVWRAGPPGHWDETATHDCELLTGRLAAYARRSRSAVAKTSAHASKPAPHMDRSGI